MYSSRKNLKKVFFLALAMLVLFGGFTVSAQQSYSTDLLTILKAINAYRLEIPEFDATYLVQNDNLSAIASEYLSIALNSRVNVEALLPQVEERLIRSGFSAYDEDNYVVDLVLETYIGFSVSRFNEYINSSAKFRTFKRNLYREIGIAYLPDDRDPNLFHYLIIVLSQPDVIPLAITQVVSDGTTISENLVTDGTNEAISSLDNLYLYLGNEVNEAPIGKIGRVTHVKITSEEPIGDPVCPENLSTDPEWLRYNTVFKLASLERIPSQAIDSDVPVAYVSYDNSSGTKYIYVQMCDVAGKSIVSSTKFVYQNPDPLPTLDTTKATLEVVATTAAAPPSATPTATPTYTATPTFTATATPIDATKIALARVATTAAAPPSATATVTSSYTPTPTFTASVTRSPTYTPTFTSSPTPTSTQTYVEILVANEPAMSTLSWIMLIGAITALVAGVGLARSYFTRRIHKHIQKTQLGKIEELSSQLRYMTEEQKLKDEQFNTELKNARDAFTYVTAQLNEEKKRADELQQEEDKRKLEREKEAAEIANQPTVFISYRRQPSAMLATFLKVELTRKYSIEVFLDVASPPDGADTISKKIREAIRHVDVFVCLVADTTFESDWVIQEVDLAYKLDLPVIPVFQESYTGKDRKSINTEIDLLVNTDGIKILDQQNLYIDEAVKRLADKIIESHTKNKDKNNK